MPVRLILNADDFGLTTGINRAISELNAANAVTSATLMAAGPAFDDAISIAQDRPGLGVGCHIVLTDGTPISPPHTIPSLLGKDGKSFRPSLISFLMAVYRGQVDERDILAETLAQIQHLQAAGIVVTHVDTHKHTHVFPGIARPLLQAAERAGVLAVRNPFEPLWSLKLSKSKLMRRLQVRVMQYLRPRFLALPQIRSGLIRTTDGTIGISATGNLNRATLGQLLAAMPDGLWEVVCHPGYNDADLDAVTTRLRGSREVERDALLSAFADSSQLRRISLINYSSTEELANL